jgi:HSP20 family protein
MTTCCTPTQTSAPAEAPALKPRFVVHSDKENYSVQIDLPGVAKDGVSINLDSNVLSVSAKRKPSVNPGWKTLHRELSDLDFLLRLKLNVPVDESKLTAKLDNGVLTVGLPVKEAAKPRRIEVN